jgi:acyl-CoA thioester hydrolase
VNGRELLWPVRVYYEDTDAGGVVYHASHLKYFERARTEWLRALGFEQDRLIREERVVFPVRRLEIDYLKPVRFNEQLTVSTVMTTLSTTRITFTQTLLRPDGETVAAAQVLVVCVDMDTFRPRPIPESILAEINA